MTISLPIFAAAILGSTTLFSLLALLLVQVRWHWLVQMLVLIAFTIPFVMLGADELLITALFQGFGILWLVKFHRSRLANKERETDHKSARWPPRIGLKKLMCGLVLLSALFAVVTQTLEHRPVYFGASEYRSAHPIRLIGIGLALAFWNLAFLVFVRRDMTWKSKFWFAFAMAALIPWAGWNDEVVLNYLRVLWHWTNFTLLGGSFMPTKLEGLSSLVPWLILLSASSLLCWGIVFGFKVIVAFAQKERPRTRSILRIVGHTAASFASVATVLLMLYSAGYCYLAVFPSPTKNQQVYFQDQLNGFATLADAGKQFRQSKIFDGFVPQLPGPILKAELLKYEGQFDAIEVGLSKPNCTWINWETGELAGIKNLVYGYDFSAMYEVRGITLGLTAKRLQRIHDAEYDELLSDGLLGIRVAETMSQDPNLLSSICGISIEGIATEIAFSAVKEASITKLETVANELDEIYSRTPSLESEINHIKENELIFAGRMGWKSSLALNLMDDGSSLESVRGATKRRNTLRILLRTEIALQLYRNANGSYPGELEMLVPKYLTKISDDPYGVKNDARLKYVVTADKGDARLYSIFIDGVDNGGVYDEDQFRTACDMDLELMTGDPLEDAKREVQAELDRQKMSDEFYDENLEFGQWAEKALNQKQAEPRLAEDAQKASGEHE